MLKLIVYFIYYLQLYYISRIYKSITIYRFITYIHLENYFVVIEMANPFEGTVKSTISFCLIHSAASGEL